MALIQAALKRGEQEEWNPSPTYCNFVIWPKYFGLDCSSVDAWKGELIEGIEKQRVKESKRGRLDLI